MDGDGVSGGKAKRISRRNTIEEKKRIRNNRRRRKRLPKTRILEKKVQDLRGAIKRERLLKEESQAKAQHFKGMSRSFWERWHWELQKRREAMSLQARSGLQTSTPALPFHEIDPSHLVNPATTTNSMTIWIGRGSFGVVKLQEYRGFQVAVKELLPNTNLADVHHEASVLMRLCHPHVPFLFGVCTQEPYRLVLQFHGIGGTSLTLWKAITEKDECVKSGEVCLGLCMQMFEALSYLHDDAGIVHNDLKCNNILLTNPSSDVLCSQSIHLASEKLRI